jgi:hypothetical protein
MLRTFRKMRCNWVRVEKGGVTYFIEEFRNSCGIKKSYFSRTSTQPSLELVKYSPYHDKLFKLNFNICLFNPFPPHVRSGFLPSNHSYFIILFVSLMYLNMFLEEQKWRRCTVYSLFSIFYFLFLLSKCSFLLLSSQHSKFTSFL